MPTEAGTCRILLAPKLQAAGWENDTHHVCRVTADEGDIGRGHMQRFQDVETRTPVILTASQLLTTGLDAPTCRNVVLVRPVNSMVEFKQIIGRGTRVRDDYGKLWFNILDYTGTATRNFVDPAFATQEEIDEDGQTQNTTILTAENSENAEEEHSKLHEEPSPCNSLPSSPELTAQECGRHHRQNWRRERLHR